MEKTFYLFSIVDSPTSIWDLGNKSLRPVACHKDEFALLEHAKGQQEKSAHQLSYVILPVIEFHITSNPNTETQ